MSHITASKTGEHDGVHGQQHSEDIDAVDVEHEEQAEQQAPESTQNPPTFPDNPEQDSEQASPCCEMPDLEGEAGDVFQLEDGSFVQLEPGDDICINCDTIHE